MSRQAVSQMQKRMALKQSQEKEILSCVRHIRAKHPRMGTRKLQHELEQSIGRDALFDLLRRHHLLLQQPKGPRTTHPGWLRFPNLLAKANIDGPDQAWVTDITYIRSDQGYLYLALVTDLYSRMIIGFDLSASLAADGALRALKMALRSSSRPLVGLIHHSDHGVQYTCHDYQRLLRSRKISCSMGEVGNCYDNAVAERVNGILKLEYFLDSRFTSLRQARKAVRQAIWLYNHERPHLSLNYQKPKAVYISQGSQLVH